MNEEADSKDFIETRIAEFLDEFFTIVKGFPKGASWKKRLDGTPDSLSDYDELLDAVIEASNIDEDNIESIIAVFGSYTANVLQNTFAGEWCNNEGAWSYILEETEEQPGIAVSPFAWMRKRIENGERIEAKFASMIEFIEQVNQDRASREGLIDTVVSVKFKYDFSNLEALTEQGSIDDGDYYIYAYGSYDSDDRFQLLWLRIGPLEKNGEGFAGVVNNFGSLDQGDGTFWSVLQNILPSSLGEDKLYNCIDSLENIILFGTNDGALEHIETDHYSIGDSLVDLDLLSDKEKSHIYFYASRTIWSLSEAVNTNELGDLKTEINKIDEKMDEFDEELELGFVLLDNE